MEKNKVIIKFEITYGPIYLSYYEKGLLYTDSDIINSNKEIIELNRKLGEIYNNWYTFDENGIPQDFNEEKQLEDANTVLGLLKELTNEIKNADKNVIIDDHETNYYMELVNK